MAMIWIFLIFAVLAIGLVQLGALSVWVTVLKVGLLAATGLVVVLLGALLWRSAWSGIRRVGGAFRERTEPHRKGIGVR